VTIKKSINLEDIRAFALIAQHGSFTAVSELLLCSRSHLSKQLNKLEANLGVKLITRTTRTQKLTEQGKLFYDQVSQGLLTIDNAIEQVVESSDAITGVLNINCVGGVIGEELITKLISDFTKVHPQVNINLDFSSRRVDLVSGEFDLVFRMGQLQDSSLICRKLTDLPIMTLATPKYLEKYDKLTHPKDLNNHQCITGSVKHWSFSNNLDASLKVDIAIEGQFQCKNGRAMLINALADNGIARLPQLYCKQELERRELVSVFDEWEIPDTPLYMVYVQNKFMPNKLKVFIEFVKNNFNNYL